MFRRLGNKRGIAECIAGLASLRAKQGKSQVATQMLAAAEALLGETGGCLVAGRSCGSGKDTCHAPGDSGGK